MHNFHHSDPQNRENPIGEIQMASSCYVFSVTSFLAHQQGDRFQSKWASQGGFPGELEAESTEVRWQVNTKLQEGRKLGDRESVDC